MTLPFDLSPGTAAFLAAALLIAAYVRGYSGFGFAA
ncbi:MAG: sulfite exporter TauE/SafE family protein, partial [Paracoccaceae bacterium]